MLRNAAVPIYEFYCRACNTVFSFFSSRVDPGVRPACQSYGAPELPRKPSRRHLEVAGRQQRGRRGWRRSARRARRRPDGGRGRRSPPRWRMDEAAEKDRSR
ncbi:MAG: hypothetical protein R2862_00750 [Thermoanaerobaculia bacterium]